MRQSSSRERSDADDRIRSLEHKLSLLEQQHQKSVLESNHTLGIKQSELSAANQALRSAQQQLQDSHPDVLKQIEFVKDDLTDLSISEALYLEYSAIDRHRQTIREYVTCSVYELVRAERNAKEASLKELDMVRALLIKSEDECDRNARERDSVAKLKRVRESEMTAELQHLEAMNSKLHEEVTRKTVLISDLQAKGEMYDSLRAKAERLEADHAELAKKDVLNALSLRALTEEKDLTASKLFNLEKSVDMLRQDKMYLTKEVERLNETCAGHVRDKERLEARLTELKRSREDMVEKLVKVREEHQHAYEEKLNAELARLQSRTAGDLESIRVNQREAFEREIKGLKERFEQLTSEHEKLRTHAEGTREDYLSLQEEHRRLASQLESERTDTRNALKLKQFEYERLSLTYEEGMADFRKLKIEHEVLTKKQSVLKQEFYSLQTDTTKRILALEAQERSLQEKLSMYQQLEYELDMAILNAGGVEDVQDKSALQSGQVRGIHHMLESLGANVPTANKRRMKQSILLAQQLVQKQKQLEVLQAELTHVKERNAELETELTAARRALDSLNQPQSYLIQNLQAKEAELAAANRRAAQCAKDLAAREEELARALTVKTQLEGDLHRLLQGKQQMDELKLALLHGQRNGFGAAPTEQLSNRENIPPHATQPHPMHRNDPRMHFGTVAASQNRPTLSIDAHNLPHGLPLELTGPQGRKAASGGDSHLESQPKPLWFQKLGR